MTVKIKTLEENQKQLMEGFLHLSKEMITSASLEYIIENQKENKALIKDLNNTIDTIKSENKELSKDYDELRNLVLDFTLQLKFLIQDSSNDNHSEKSAMHIIADFTNKLLNN